MGDAGAWAHAPGARAALSTVSRDLHLLVFDPEREVFLVVYAKADPQTQLQLLISYGLWPSGKTLRVVDASGNTLWEFLGESGASTVQVLEEQLRNGDLLR